MSSKVLENQDQFRLDVEMLLDEIEVKEMENVIESNKSESEEEDMQDPKRKQETWDKLIKHNQRTVETMSRKLRRVTRPNTYFGNITGDRSKGVNRDIIPNKYKRLKQNEQY